MFELQELLQWCRLEPAEGQQRATPVGSAAVMQAHKATLRAQTAERQLEAAVAERDALARQVQELKPPVLVDLPDQDGAAGTCIQPVNPTDCAAACRSYISVYHADNQFAVTKRI